MSGLRASSEGDDAAKRQAAAEEAERWKAMASKMAEQRKEVADGPSPVRDAPEVTFFAASLCLCLSPLRARNAGEIAI